VPTRASYDADHGQLAIENTRFLKIVSHRERAMVDDPLRDVDVVRSSGFGRRITNENADRMTPSPEPPTCIPMPPTRFRPGVAGRRLQRGDRLESNAPTMAAAADAIS
jgi:hypothetical protein